ncbi:facilitated trehalose transporter Tret1-like [Musca domestica]|uniref:Facilitated trehalose transporter Tret1 n=2 Tax=Musca domestica TaxID=7370 RepID=A0A1I8MZW3_MUSDO|nr:facilitated trehalose transporter Tret1 [Musca domestica]XP_058986837.1 facilitated trehalose transporter Tret1-like [Musca domestica]
MKMFINSGIFKEEYRRQLLASLSVTMISLAHGIGLGWLSPMLPKLQSPTDTPIDFTVNVDESSWIGALISVGGVIGNITFLLIFDRWGRKAAIYGLAIPHMCLWMLLYFAESVEYLYAARICGGLTGGGVFIVIPIFISEIADPLIRGRLTSIFSLSLNLGILFGFIVSSYVHYHIIPLVVLPLPCLYLVAAIYFPDTPQFLLRKGRCAEALKSFLFYKNIACNNKVSVKAETQRQFDDLKMLIEQQQNQNASISSSDFLNKRSMFAICSGVVLMLLNMFCGSFALVNYMSSVFAAIKSELHPDVNTIIVGVVQVIGTYTATILVDRFGRKVLLLVSTSGMGVGLAAFGIYAFFAEETEADLSFYSHWLPLVLMAFIIFIANVGILSVTVVVLVEILPSKIRSIASSFCLALLSLFAFISLRIFPLSMHYFGLSATMWFCATICAFGLFYISIFLEETKGKPMEGN